MVNESMPASCSLAAIHRPDIPAPIIAIFRDRLCVMATTWPLACLHVTPSASAYRRLHDQSGDREVHLRRQGRQAHGLLGARWDVLIRFVTSQPIGNRRSACG